MSKIQELTQMNALDEVQSVLVYRLTSFSRLIASKRFTTKEVQKRVKDILLSLEEVGGFYEELAKQ